MSKPKFSTIKIGTAVYEKAAEYSAKTGVPIKTVIDEAVSDWLMTVGTARLEAIETSKKNLEHLADYAGFSPKVTSILSAIGDSEERAKVLSASVLSDS